MVPTFKMHGSKCRTRNWIYSCMPDKIDGYYEPFAGRGNVFYGVAAKKIAKHYSINDLYMGMFLTAIRDYTGDFDFVEEHPITRDKYEKWLYSELSKERTISECFLAYNGNIYGAGCNNTLNSLNRHSKVSTIKRLKAARELLQGVEISQFTWSLFMSMVEFHKNDLVYIDPPYYGTKAFYDNIDHSALCDVVNMLPCSVILSGYENPYYDAKLVGFTKRQRDRQSVAKANSGASGSAITVTETLWIKVVA